MDERDSGRDDRESPVGTDGGERRADETPATDSVQDEAVERQRERTDRVEDSLAAVREDLGDQKYPVSSEELSAAYADQTIDLPNETESLGSVFRRIDETFEDEGAAYRAVVTELSTDEQVAVRANAADPEPATWSEERAGTQHEFEEDPIDGEDYESSIERTRERAREAQAESEPEPDDEEQ